MKADSSGKYQNRYVFSSRLICGECGEIFRRQKIYIGKPYEKVQWCCIGHIRDRKQCSQKAVREDILQQAFVVMWNKLASNYKEILIPFLDSLKRLRADEQQEHEIRACNNKIMELTKQSHILSQIVAKGYIDSAVFMEKQMALNVELDVIREQRNQLIDNSGFEEEIFHTERLLELIRNQPDIIEVFDEDLFFQSIEQVVIKTRDEMTFRFRNKLEFTENF